MNRYAKIKEAVDWIESRNANVFGILYSMSQDVDEAVKGCEYATRMSVDTKVYGEHTLEHAMLKAALPQMRLPEFREYVVQKFADVVNGYVPKNYDELRAKFSSIPNCIRWFEDTRMQLLWRKARLMRDGVDFSLAEFIESLVPFLVRAAEEQLQTPSSAPLRKVLEAAFPEMEHPQFVEYVTWKLEQED